MYKNIDRVSNEERGGGVWPMTGGEKGKSEQD